MLENIVLIYWLNLWLITIRLSDNVDRKWIISSEWCSQSFTDIHPKQTDILMTIWKSFNVFIVAKVSIENQTLEAMSILFMKKIQNCLNVMSVQRSSSPKHVWETIWKLTMLIQVSNVKFVIRPWNTKGVSIGIKSYFILMQLLSVTFAQGFSKQTMMWKDMSDHLMGWI